MSGNVGSIPVLYFMPLFRYLETEGAGDDSGTLLYVSTKMIVWWENWTKTKTDIIELPIQAMYQSVYGHHVDREFSLTFMLHKAA